MSNDLIEHLEHLNIRVYVMADGSTIIGRLVEAHEYSVEVDQLCELRSIYLNGAIEQLILPKIPCSNDQTAIISRQHVMIESAASLTLKKSFIDSQLMIKINSLDVNDSLAFKDRWTPTS